ncbi:MAG: hypothetical protein ACOYUZ_00510 [Patescibacteria group bacterium]
MDKENIVKLYAAYLGCNADVAEGQVNFHLEGGGALDSRLVDLEVSMNGEDSVLKPLRDAYYAVKGMEAPPLSLTVETADNYEIEKLKTALKSLEPSESAD